MRPKDKSHAKLTDKDAVELSDNELDSISGGPEEIKTVLENGAGKFKIEIDGAVAPIQPAIGIKSR